MHAKYALLMAAMTLVAAETTWTPEFSMKVRQVGAVEVSADGSRVAWTETRPVMDGEKSEQLTHIFVARSDGSERFQLTQGEKSCNAPVFAKDGQSVFFASDREGKRNIYQIALDGGEAERLTDLKGTLGAFSLSPDGKWIAFTAADPTQDEEAAKREKRDFRVIGENPKNQSLWLLPLTGKRTARKVASGAYTVGAVSWSPDSRRIAFETRPTPDADDGSKSDILEVEIETGNVRGLAATPAAEAQPRYSPDGRYLAFVRGSSPRSVLGSDRIVLLNRETGKDRELPPTYDEAPRLMGWSKDAKRIFFSEAKRTRAAIYAMPVDGPPAPIFDPSKGTFGFAASVNETGTHMGFAFQSSDEPVEAYVMDVATAKPVRVSAANSGLAMPPLGETRLIRWKSKDGKEIEGLLTLPVNYDKSKKYPLILNIHGGPAGAFAESFIGASALYPIASFASKGYAVLRCNIRGSSAYGRQFRGANLNDWGGGDFQDLMTGVDSVIAQGIADPNRLAVMGWSYGGYMTNWVIGQTTRFKAAATGAGLSDMISMWGTNDIPSVLDDYFSGPPMQSAEMYIKQSPLYYVKNVTTPTLILHGEQDNRVPTAQGYEMYHALQRRGVAAEMVVYPRTPHGPQEPKFVLDIMKRHIAWVEKYIGANAGVSN